MVKTSYYFEGYRFMRACARVSYQAAEAGQLQAVRLPSVSPLLPQFSPIAETYI